MKSSRHKLNRWFERLESRSLLNVGDLYNAPTSPRSVQNLDLGWNFALNPSGTPQSTSFNDSSWSNVDLPYTWDGAATTSPPTGSGWFRKTISVASNLIGDEFYLQFEGAYLVTNLYIDGVQVDYNPNVAGTDPHNGGWSGFAFDITSQLSAGSHLIAVQVNNSSVANVSPGNTGNTGDYNHEGGLYRDVSLIAVPKTHVALIENAIDVPPNTSPASIATNTPISTPGVYFATTSNVTIGIAAANIQVKTLLDNQSVSSSSVTVTSYLVDANGVIQSQQISTQAISAGQTSAAVTQSSTVANPHLWDGRIDPYLYDLYVEVRDSSTNQLLDLSHQQVGIRSFKINASPNPSDPNLANQDQAAFELNGHPYTLVGVDMHQDSGVAGQLGLPAGWAQTDAEIQSDVNMALDLGVTVIRTSHYPDNQAFYSDCDRAGILVFTEVGLQQNATSTTPNSAFVNNLDDQLTEMIKQNYNHASIFAWGLYNETGTANGTLIQNLSNLAHVLDSTRYSAGASNQGSATDTINAAPDIIGRHFYDGWYGSVPENMSAELDSFHNANPTHPMGVTEFGGAASAYQYANNVLISPPNTTDKFHPENTQSQLEERQWAELASKNYLWADIVWQMFDATSPGKNEGDTSGVNDKGLVTRDRSTKKDTYYFYQANWNDPTRGWANQNVLYISDHNWTDRQGSTSTLATTVTVYSNLGAPTLSLNGSSLGTMTQSVISGKTIPDTYSMTVNLAAGANAIQVNRLFNGQTYTDSVVWTYRNTTLGLGGTQYARVDFTNSSSNLQSGYVADTGQAFNGTYGWANPTTHAASANTAGTYNRTSTTTSPFDQIKTRTGILLPTAQVWEYAVPNGLYDVHIVAADSTNPAMVNNLNVEGTLLHDTDYSTDNGDNGFDEFYSQVYVADGRLTIAAGAGSWAPRLAYIDINVVDNTPPSVLASNFQYPGPQQLQIQFSENVGSSLTAADLILTNLTTGSAVDPATIALSYNTATNTASFTFPGFAGGILPVGNYQATLLANSVTDAVGNKLTGNFNLAIPQLVGDWDLNGRLTVSDISAMMNGLIDLQGFQSVHSLSAELNLLGDSNGDSVISNADLQSLISTIANSASNAGGGALARVPNGGIRTTEVFPTIASASSSPLNSQLASSDPIGAPANKLISKSPYVVQLATASLILESASTMDANHTLAKISRRVRREISQVTTVDSDVIQD